ncbi:MAG TPA: TetR/AcrR family transcriptional regulator [Solirubrobacteraceae bacterium]|jgi:AcrR family transcriptional regulator
MPRRELHSQEAILDAARKLVVEGGPRSVTVGAVAAASQAPTGSIYHRFTSVDELLARLWIRAVRRSQEATLTVDFEDPAAGVIAAALALYDFCLEHREDALLLGAFRRRDLERAELPGELREELKQVNEPIERPLGELVRRLLGSKSRASLDIVLLAVVDLPYGFARRYLDGEGSPPPERRERLAAAVEAVLGLDPQPQA